jgi:acyl-CoA reductase-like NAD-dependent aldehyde dehydrogenase
MSYGLVKNLVAGDFVVASSGAMLDVVDPSTDGGIVGQVPAMGPADLVEVFDSAERGARTWRATGQIERGRVLLTAATLIRQDADALTDVIVTEMGKTRAEASGEVGKAAEFFEYYGALARLPYGELVPDGRPGTYASQIREPLGVVVLITPWNDPLLTPARKLAPALLAGNAVVIKPSTETPIIALRLAEILHRAGLPEGVLGTVTGLGREIGDALVADHRIRAVSFTGSTAVGIELQRTLAGRGVRVQTEMGGKNAAVVLDDADLDIAVPTIVAGAYAQAGQRCTATSRLVAQSGIAEELRARVATAVSELIVGAGTHPNVDVSPVVSTSAQADIRRRVASAINEGAEVIARSPLSADQQKVGAYAEPVFLAVDRSNSVWRDEVFGPVLAMSVVGSLDEAIAVVNDSAYGLASAVFTRSLDSAMTFVDAVNTGQVSVNQPTSGWDVHQPFGGFKDSGSPFKEQGLEALRFYTRVKTAAIRTR